MVGHALLQLDGTFLQTVPPQFQHHALTLGPLRMYQPFSQHPNTHSFLFSDDLGSLTSAVGGFDSFDARGVHPVIRYRIGDDILGAKAEAGKNNWVIIVQD